MKICVVVGHSKLKNGMITSADGRSYGGCNEYNWCKTFSGNLVSALKRKGHTVDKIVCPENKFVRKEEEHTYKIITKNLRASKYDLIIELHLNSWTSTTARGYEVLYKSEKGKEYAKKIAKGLAKTFSAHSQGVIKRDNLYILNDTKSPAVIIEHFFCTSKSDYKKAKGLANRMKIAKDIADALS